jgi:hypothetical protein
VGGEAVRELLEEDLKSYTSLPGLADVHDKPEDLRVCYGLGLEEPQPAFYLPWERVVLEIFGNDVAPPDSSHLWVCAWQHMLTTGLSALSEMLATFHREIERQPDPESSRERVKEFVVDCAEYFDLDFTLYYKGMFRALRDRVGLGGEYEKLLEKVKLLNEEKGVEDQAHLNLNIQWLTMAAVFSAVAVLVVPRLHEPVLQMWAVFLWAMFQCLLSRDAMHLGKKQYMSVFWLVVAAVGGATLWLVVAALRGPGEHLVRAFCLGSILSLCGSTGLLLFTSLLPDEHRRSWKWLFKENEKQPHPLCLAFGVGFAAVVTFLVLGVMKNTVWGIAALAACALMVPWPVQRWLNPKPRDYRVFFNSVRATLSGSAFFLAAAVIWFLAVAGSVMCRVPSSARSVLGVTGACLVDAIVKPPLALSLALIAATCLVDALLIWRWSPKERRWRKWILGPFTAFCKLSAGSGSIPRSR